MKMKAEILWGVLHIWNVVVVVILVWGFMMLFSLKRYLLEGYVALTLVFHLSVIIPMTYSKMKEELSDEN